MSKGSKFRSSFTLRHYWDEWWDQRTQEWKVKLFISLGLLAVLGVLSALLWTHRWLERDEVMAEAKRIHQKRIQNSDKVMALGGEPVSVPQLRIEQKIETRSDK